MKWILITLLHVGQPNIANGPFDTLDACKQWGSIWSRQAKANNEVMLSLQCVPYHSEEVVSFNFNADGHW